MVVNPLATGAVYLAMAVPPALWASRHSRRPWAAGIFGAVVGMFASWVFASILPFNYWAHANDFILEPFILRRRPWGATAWWSAAFHLGAPAIITVLWRRKWPAKDDW